MLPLSEYAVVPEDATIMEALEILEASQKSLPPGRQPHRAVLVRGRNGKIVGKLGQLGFLKSLEPRYNALGDIETLSRAGLSSEFISSMMENMRFWRDDITDVCARARTTRIADAMHPVTENIDENAYIVEAVHMLVMWQTLSILVTRNGEVVGILRLSDVFGEISHYIQSCPK